MQDIVIGAVMNYDYSKIAPWLKSLIATGYSGKIALIAYSMDAETIKRLTDENVTLFIFSQDEAGNATYPFTPNFNIMVERFAHAWYFLKNIQDEIRNVIMTDVGDVIFQSNPSESLNVLGIYVGGENLTYENEVWSKRNLTLSFGEEIYNTFKDRQIICAGVVAGDYNSMVSLCLQVFLVCRGSAPHTQGGGGPDQAALNIILHSDGFGDFVADTGAFVHLGTHSEAIKAGSGDIGLQYKMTGKLPTEHYLFPEAIINKIGDDYFIISPATGREYPIIHQYNRIPDLKEYYERKFA